MICVPGRVETIGADQQSRAVRAVTPRQSSSMSSMYLSGKRARRRVREKGTDSHESSPPFTCAFGGAPAFDDEWLTIYSSRTAAEGSRPLPCLSALSMSACVCISRKHAAILQSVSQYIGGPATWSTRTVTDRAWTDRLAHRLPCGV